ncbi:MAG TPA: ATP-binding protein [Candidatus Limnocylindria bacterium]|nr:ATP-binding protein [Candidatus Limnocylindria bacterium]
MNGAELVRLVTNALFLVVFVGALRTALRERSRTSIDATILFGALAVIVAQSQIAAFIGTQVPAALGIVSAVLFLALPYLQLRLVDDFAGVPPLALRVCVGGLVLGIGAAVVGALQLVVLPAALPVIIALALLYFVGFCTYAAVVLIREARQAKGVARNRMVAAACGALALSLTLIVALGASVVGPMASVASMILSLTSAVGYLVAFAPPVLLKRAWREPALRSFLTRAASISPHDPPETILRSLEIAIGRAAPGQSARIAVVDEKTQALVIGDDEDLLSLAEGMAGIVEAQTPRFLRTAGGVTLAAPITGRGRRIGVLAVTGTRAPLFASDDLDLVQLLAEQAAIVLDGARLYGDLASANRDLSQATKVKSEFLANMSHELRTPLNAILGFSGLLSEQLAESMSEKQRRFLRNIQEAGDHLLDLINDVLDLSKVEAGRLDLRPEIVTLDALLEPVSAAARTAAQLKGVVFTVESPEAPPLYLDPTRVRQVLFNLVSNAVKFTPSGGHVRLRALADGRELRFEVADTGVGIPSAARDRVFGVFERFHEGQSDASGTGLGLALTKRLVEQMKGAITFDSAEGTGSTFKVQLFDVVAEQVIGERILVIEDERHDADLIVAVAASMDLRAEVVRGLAGTEDALARGRPLGVVLDLRLLDGRGEKFLGRLRTDPALADVPVIVVTVEADPATTLALGADDYLTKPIDRVRLESWLRRLRQRADDRARPNGRRQLAHSPR